MSPRPDNRILRPRATRSRAVSPCDAATLIILRRDTTVPRILMGRRAARLKFMPGKFVFPGGRTDPSDRRAPHGTALRPAVRHRLAAMTTRASDDRLKAIAMTAIRETFEETGLVLGRTARRTHDSSDPVWRAYFGHSAEPDLARMEFIARAITPPGYDPRFDTRFFLIDADAILSDPDDLSRASGELEDLRWTTLPDAVSLDIADITRFILDDLETRLSLSAAARHPIPFIYYRHGRTIHESL